MDQSVIVVFLMAVQQCMSVFHGVSHMAPPKVLRPGHFEPLRQVAMIKQEILRHLGITDAPRAYQDTQRTRGRVSKDEPKINQYKLTDIASFHSEPPDNFTDEHIVQFRLFKRDYEKPIEVNNVNLIVRIKLRKTKTDRTDRKQRDLNENRADRKQRRKKNFKEINLMVYNVTTDGKPGNLLTSLKSKLRKTKTIKLGLPSEIVQNAVESSKRTLQFFIQCEGCDKKTRLILVHKRRQKHMTKTRGSKHPRLHKRRPILFVYSHITSGS